MICKYEEIPLADIDSSNAFYRITTRSDVHDLQKSIASNGLLHPPWVVSNGESYTIVGGFRRISACGLLGWKGITAGIVEPSVSHTVVASLAIVENTAQRSLNPIEQMRALKLAERFCGSQSELIEFCRSTGLPDNLTLIKKILRLADMPPELQTHILSGSLSLSMALRLFDSAPESATFFADLFQELRAGLNIQKEIFSHAYEVARCKSIPITVFMNEPDLRNVLSDPEMDRSRKLDTLRALLRKKRYPTLVEWEERFSRKLAEIDLDPCMTLEAPKAFEGRTFTLQMRFSSPEDLSQCCREMERLRQSGYMQKILTRADKG